jgi:hypothetical protein
MEIEGRIGGVPVRLFSFCESSEGKRIWPHTESTELTEWELR